MPARRGPSSAAGVAAYNFNPFDGREGLESLQIPVPLAYERSPTRATECALQNPECFRSANSIYGKATPWTGCVFVEMFASAVAQPSAVVRVVIQRPKLPFRSQTWRETADDDMDGGQALGASANWSHFIRDVVGPDTLVGVLAGPELTHMISRRVKSPSSVVRYELTAIVRESGSYNLHLEHKFYNFGGLHDRDKYGAPFESTLLLHGSKHNKMTRAGAIKLSKQRLKCRPLPSAEADAAVGDVTASAEHQRLSCPHLTHREATTQGIRIQLPAAPTERDEGGGGPTGTIRTSWCGINEPFARGRYRHRSSHSNRNRHDDRDGTAVIIRGWHKDETYPLSSVAYEWAPLSCALRPLSFLLSQQPQAAAAAVAETTLTSAATPLRQCLNHPLHRLKRILMVGDSQIRTLFHTLLAAMEGTMPIISKAHYGHQVFGSVEVEFIWDPLLLNLSAASQRHARWDLLQQRASEEATKQHPSTASSAARDNPQRRRAQQQQQQQWSGEEAQQLVDQELAEDSNEMLTNMEWEHAQFGPESHIGVSLYHEGASKGNLWSVRRRMSGVLQRALTRGGGSDMHDDGRRDASKAAPLSDTLLSAPMDALIRKGHAALQHQHQRQRTPPRRDHAVVEECWWVGFGGWFGIHVWTLEEFQAHVEDVVDALVTLTAARRAEGRPSPLVVFSGTPAWPSYVPWEGHRRNTNSRLGLMVQLARRSLLAAHRANLLRVAIIPYFEMSLPMSHMRVHETDIHYDRSVVPYGAIQYFGTWLCNNEEQPGAVMK